MAMLPFQENRWPSGFPNSYDDEMENARAADFKRLKGGIRCNRCSLTNLIVAFIFTCLILRNSTGFLKNFLASTADGTGNCCLIGRQAPHKNNDTFPVDGAA